MEYEDRIMDLRPSGQSIESYHNISELNLFKVDNIREYIGILLIILKIIDGEVVVAWKLEKLMGSR
jgi:hypothetical protein